MFGSCDLVRGVIGRALSIRRGVVSVFGGVNPAHPVIARERRDISPHAANAFGSKVSGLLNQVALFTPGGYQRAPIDLRAIGSGGVALPQDRR